MGNRKGSAETAATKLKRRLKLMKMLLFKVSSEDCWQRIYLNQVKLRLG